MTGESVAHLDHVAVRFDELDVLRDVSLAVAAGESLAIVGPSGSGKSTLLAVLGALLQPTSGDVRIAGHDPGSLSEEEVAQLRNEHIGFVFQSHHLLPQCTALENVLVPALARHDDAGPYAERARKLLQRVGLGERMQHRPGELSGGERQRVAVVRALLLEPELILADEPTGALDRRTADEIAQLLTELVDEEGAALVTVTHAPSLAARMGRVLELDDGTLRERDAP